MGVRDVLIMMFRTLSTAKNAVRASWFIRSLCKTTTSSHNCMCTDRTRICVPIVLSTFERAPQPPQTSFFIESYRCTVAMNSKTLQMQEENNGNVLLFLTCNEPMSKQPPFFTHYDTVHILHVSSFEVLECENAIAKQFLLSDPRILAEFHGRCVQEYVRQHVIPQGQKQQVDVVAHSLGCPAAAHAFLLSCKESSAALAHNLTLVSPIGMLRPVFLPYIYLNMFCKTDVLLYAVCKSLSTWASHAASCFNADHHDDDDGGCWWYPANSSRTASFPQTYMVYGKNDPFVSWKDGPEVVRRLRPLINMNGTMKLSLCVMASAGHVPYLENTESFDRVYRTWMDYKKN